MRTACLMMQKNEFELMDKWIIYHGNLFGFENLYIFDNGSEIDFITNSIHKYQSQGVNFILDYNRPEDFEKKGEILGKKIVELDLLGQHEFFFPLDCDEFIAVIDDRGAYSCHREDIAKELSLHKSTGDVLLIRKQLFNSPFSRDWFHSRLDRKSFFKSGTFGSLDIGFHYGKSRLCDGEHSTSIIQFHFHNKPFPIIRKHAEEKLKLRVELTDLDKISAYSGAGHHMAKYFLMDEKKYLSDFTEMPFEAAECLSRKFTELKISWPYDYYFDHSQKVILENSKYSLAKKYELESTPHYGVFGYVDIIQRHTEHLKISGWGLSSNREAIKHFKVLINEEFLILASDVTYIERPDVAGRHPGASSGCGFEINLPLTSIPSEPLTIRSVSVYGAQHSSALGGAILLSQMATKHIKEMQS